MLVPKLLTCMNDLCVFFYTVHHIIHHRLLSTIWFLKLLSPSNRLAISTSGVERLPMPDYRVLP